jgi:hypothetical protein
VLNDLSGNYKRGGTAMAWLRTREIKPGVYETQSAGFHFGKQVGIAAGVLVGAILIVMGVVALFEGNVFPILFFGIPLAAIGCWHWSYHRKNAREPRQPGPWD